MMRISRWSSGLPRRILLAISIFFFLSFLYTWREAEYSESSLFRNRHRFSLGKTTHTDPGPGCALDIDYLKNERYGLNNTVVFHRQCVRANRNDALDRNEVSDVSGSIFGRWQAVDLNDDCHMYEPMPCEPIDLDVPSPFPDRHYPELLFGVATSFDRLVDSIPQLSHWLGNSGARLVATVVDAAEREDDLGRLISFFRDHGVDLVVARPMPSPTEGGLGVNEHHFTVIRDLLHHSTPETKWVGIIDDDTFFPSLHPVAEVLKDQDHTTPAYLGGLSDSMWAIQQHGLLAYGGAGVFLSMPLMRLLDPRIETCLIENNSPQGDALLKNCIYSQTEARLTIVPGLNQLDIRGDPSGFYESGRWPLSLHHWKTWHNAPVDLMAKASSFCGGCFLQRWLFGGDTVLSNGYSVAVYRQGIEHADLNHTEATFDNAHLYDWAYGPLRDKADDYTKKSFYLVDSEQVGKSLRQLYIHRVPESRDEILELWWDWS